MSDWLNIEYRCARWLWLERGCVVVLRERTPCYMAGQPDVFGITAARFTIEIEIKRSYSDFRADFAKTHRRNRHLYLDRQPKQFYYCIPKSLKDRIEPEVPDWAGLMTISLDNFYPQVSRVSPINSESKRLSVKQCCKLLRVTTNYAMGLESSLDSIVSQFRYGHSPYIPEGVIDYTI